MDEIKDFFVTVGGYVGGALGVGGALVVGGIILLVAARSALPENRKVMKWIGWPLVGCGGCIVIIPVIIILAIVGLGAMMLTCRGC